MGENKKVASQLIVVENQLVKEFAVAFPKLRKMDPSAPLVSDNAYNTGWRVGVETGINTTVNRTPLNKQQQRIR